MKSRLFLVGAIIGLALVASPLIRISAADPKNMIIHADSVIMSGGASQADLKGALTEFLDASLLILPETDANAECRSRIEVAKAQVGEKSIFSEKGRQYLAFAYRLVADGKAWQVPQEMSGAYRQKDIMEQAKKAARRLMDAALAGLEAGRGEESVRFLLDYVLMVITPIEA